MDPSEWQQLLDHMRRRRSVRRFQPDPVPPELVERLLEAARWAPSASNRQDWLFTVVSSNQVKQAMAEAVRQRWRQILRDNAELVIVDEIRTYAESFDSFARAPVVVAVAATRVAGFQRQLLGEHVQVVAGSRTSAAMATQNLMLLAPLLGLATCCMTGALAAAEELAEILDLGRRHELVCLVAVGFPDEAPPAPPRKPVAEIARFVE